MNDCRGSFAYLGNGRIHDRTNWMGPSALFADSHYKPFAISNDCLLGSTVREPGKRSCSKSATGYPGEDVRTDF